MPAYLSDVSELREGGYVGEQTGRPTLSGHLRMDRALEQMDSSGFGWLAPVLRDMRNGTRDEELSALRIVHAWEGRDA